MSISGSSVRDFVVKYGAFASSEDEEDIKRIEKDIKTIFDFNSPTPEVLLYSISHLFKAWKGEAWRNKHFWTVDSFSRDSLTLQEAKKVYKSFYKTYEKLNVDIDKSLTLIKVLNNDQEQQNDLHPLQSLKDRSIRVVITNLQLLRLMKIVSWNTSIYDDYLILLTKTENKFANRISKLLFNRPDWIEQAYKLAAPLKQLHNPNTKNYFLSFIADHSVVIGKVPAAFTGKEMNISAKLVGKIPESPQILIKVSANGSDSSIRLFLTSLRRMRGENGYRTDFTRTSFDPRDVIDRKVLINDVRLDINNVQEVRVTAQILAELLYRENVSDCQFSRETEAKFSPVASVTGFKMINVKPFPQMEKRPQEDMDEGKILPSTAETPSHTLSLIRWPDQTAGYGRNGTRVLWKDLIEKEPFFSGSGPILPQ